MHVGLISLLLVLGAEPNPDVLVVCPPSFAPALRPWVDHREAQGHQIQFYPNQVSPYSIRDAIRAAYRAGSLEYVLLVGDALPTGFGNTEDRKRTTPTFHPPSRVVINWGPDIDIASDNWYADVDDDQLPDVAIGRLTADSAEELRTMVGKILEFEKGDHAGRWKRRVNFVAGVGDFGPLIDTVIETATKKFLTEGIPPAYDTSMTYGNWRSPYCPNPYRFRELTLQRLNEGCLFWVYIGHGHRAHLDRIRFIPSSMPILSVRDVADLKQNGCPPIAIFLACYSGAFDGMYDCLAESLIRSPEGPVAVFAGSRVTMPYAMAVMGNELMREHFVSRRETLGQLILHAKRRMAANASAGNTAEIDSRQWLDALGAMFSPESDRLDEERREHVHLFNLLGDPLLRLPHADQVQLQTSEIAYAGDRLMIRGTTDVAGKMTLELVCRRDQSRNTPPLRLSIPESREAFAGFTRTYDQANDRCWTVFAIDCEEGEFEAELQIPSTARGPCYVRAFVEGSSTYAVGACPVLVRSARHVQRLAEKPESADRSQDR